ncbi:hypothetical protein [Streptomyces sp. GS7]|uniref:hypothetical protein n=1 Tax=Streptomyces sp. GS7 TaxID=2692234 RepID=UPI001318A6C2|nr:hypothetical protein [Streptomyces sp. GS7]QHC24619.1 hypothetical protein GR130_27875 [Streptomyces sp. GS7]
MNDFQDRRPALRASAGTAGQGSSGTAGSVHQVVFRWDGNQGRQGTGMKAVAHSCSAERAEELGRELGPLLWVSGAPAPRQSVVRTLSRDGEVMLVQRWPTTDRGGRPSTVSHVLVGEPQTLKTRQCLGLAHGGWGKRESAEQATGRQHVVECAALDKLARERLPGMRELLPTVKHALTLVTAEWLRDPTQRVSLLTGEEELPGWPGQDAAPLVYLGLFMLFGPWLGQEWTFATYDMVDTHPLRLMSVPRWEPDTGGSGPLARVMCRPPAHPRFEHRAAAQLVAYLLGHPADRPGVPQLVDGLGGGAALDWPRRRALLEDILDADRLTAPHPATPPRLPDREPDLAATAPPPALQPDPAPLTPTPTSAPASVSTPSPSPSSPPTTPPRPGRAPAPRPTAPATGYPAADTEPTPLHEVLEDLHVLRRRNAAQRGKLADRLRTLPDDLLLRELRSGGLPPESVELLLNALGDDDRVRKRGMEMRHALCAEVLRNGLYLAPNEPGTEPASRTALAGRAADLFTWAVAPLAGDERYLRDLQELLHRMCRDRHPAAGNWLREAIIAPRNGRAPELPPILWQQILRDVIGQSPAQSTTSHEPLATPAYTSSPEPTDLGPGPRTSPSRLSELTNSLGCVVGTGAGVIALLLLSLVLISL